MISYTKDKNLLSIVFEGETSLQDIVNFLDLVDKITDIGDTIRLLYDLQGAGFIFEADSVPKINTKAAEVTQKYKTVRTAFIVNDPKSTAYAYLFAELSNDQKNDRKMFSDKSNALHWIRADY